MTLQSTIETTLRQLFNPSQLAVINESHHHAGHAGVAGDTSGNTHFKIEIMSAEFIGLSRVQCHQKIYAALAPWMNNPIHALSIDASSEPPSAH